MVMTATLPERLYANRELVEDIRAHNCAVIIRRRRGEDWTAPENQYRNAIAEIDAAELAGRLA